MRSIADLQKIFELAQFFLNERGYIVIGTPVGQYKPGETTTVIWNVEVGHPFRITQHTDFSDWKEQSQMASAAFPQTFKKAVYVEAVNTSLEMDAECYFYRVITD